ncbi:MAG: 4,5-DOPA dioxygenase extradiol [Alphaproteobacteria bacterium]
MPITQMNLQILSEHLKPSEKMPIMFIGHGSPMNAINDSEWSQGWALAGQILPRPQAILCISAHWITQKETFINVQKTPPTIHDFGGFPSALFQVQYPAPGAPDIAQEVINMLATEHVHATDDWGLDHGAWSVLKLLYPNADIPVFQMSIDYRRSFSEQLEIGHKLKKLREKGVLVLGSGNLVHNLHDMRSDGRNYDWAIEFDEMTAQAIENRNFSKLAEIDRYSALFRKAHPTADHFMPALYCLGLAEPTDKLTFFNEGMDLGSISMRSFIFHQR